MSACNKMHWIILLFLEMVKSMQVDVQVKKKMRTVCTVILTVYFVLGSRRKEI